MAMGWRGQHNRDLANERDSNRHRVHLGLFVFAAVLFYAMWVAASMR